MNSEKRSAADLEGVSGTEKFSIRELIFIVDAWILYLRRKWILIAIFTCIGGIAGFLYASTRKTTYTALTTFVLEANENSGGLMQYAGLASMVGFDIGGGGGGIFQGDNIIELYKSRKMLQSTLLSPVLPGSKELLIDRYLTMSRMRDNWADREDLKSLKFSPIENPRTAGDLQINRLRDSVLDNVVTKLRQQHLRINKVDKKLAIIEVEVTSADEVFSKSFNDRLVANVNDFYLRTKTKRSLENIAILQYKTDSVRSVMNGAIYSAATIADATPNINPTRQVQRVAPVQRYQFSMETNKAMLAELLKNLEMAKISVRKEAPLLQIVDEPIYPLPKKKFSAIKGIVFGAFVMAFLTIIWMSARRFYLNTLASGLRG
ncbi:lipopolysaccharide biosynthesis protein [Pedobacter yulinensis]|uniref:Lipopolysaccharide biosynthesis protein n=2 Tax=Pedobacter yulinensis TaxID=2126353 RepID=A0A2T3HPY3_9SPHI|nr:lipopolysaccharide biosynthesis protein [Pedobacter yulinensis]